MAMPSAANSGRSGRDANGLWRTPPEATLALILALRPFIGPVVHEPCCGAGDMARVLVAEGFRVISTDLVDHGYGTPGVDFLKDTYGEGATIITNPPFPQAAAFVEHACAQSPRFFALLLKATYWSAAERVELYERRMPKLTLPLTWRLDFTGEGRPTMECAWFVWGSAVPGPQAPILLRKPNSPWGVFA